MRTSTSAPSWTFHSGLNRSLRAWAKTYEFALCPGWRAGSRLPSASVRQSRYAPSDGGKPHCCSVVGWKTSTLIATDGTSSWTAVTSGGKGVGLGEADGCTLALWLGEA